MEYVPDAPPAYDPYEEKPRDRSVRGSSPGYGYDKAQYEPTAGPPHSRDRGQDHLPAGPYQPPPGPPNQGYGQPYPPAGGYNPPQGAPYDAYGAGAANQYYGQQQQEQAGAYASAAGPSSRGPSSSNPNAPTPPSFSRTPQPHFGYPPFPPCTATSLGSELSSGFPVLPPPCYVQPHPFTTHDVSEEDWARFLDDVRRAGASGNKFVASVAPVMRGVGLISGLIGKALTADMASDKQASVESVIQHWNNYFFHPRMMEVNLARGRVVYTGSGRLPIELEREGYHHGEEYYDSDPIQYPVVRGVTRQLRYERRAVRREWITGVPAQQMGGHANEPWKLILTSRPRM